MIKFFRNIRYKSMENSKSSRYFKYAIGEIILVVIGILIALQINNWNEANKEKVFEMKVLSELYLDVKEDIKEMNNAIDSLQVSNSSNQLILNQLSNRTIYHDSLDKHFAFALRLWSLSPNITSFEMAKEKGMYLIKNDSIRFRVAKANGYFFDYVKVLEDRFQDYKSNVLLPYIIPLFHSYNFQSMKPRDYEALLDDKTFESMIKTLIPMRARYMNLLEKRCKLVKDLEGMLKSEIDD